MSRRLLRFALLPAIFAAGNAGASAPAPAGATPATIIFGSCPERPVWPPAAQAEKREGTVALVFTVDADSTLLEAVVARTSGHADLDEAARVGLGKCKFRPATQDGKPVPGRATVRYSWKL